MEGFSFFARLLKHGINRKWRSSLNNSLLIGLHVVLIFCKCKRRFNGHVYTLYFLTYAFFKLWVFCKIRNFFGWMVFGIVKFKSFFIHKESLVRQCHTVISPPPLKASFLSFFFFLRISSMFFCFINAHLLMEYELRTSVKPTSCQVLACFMLGTMTLLCRFFPKFPNSKITNSSVLHPHQSLCSSKIYFLIAFTPEITFFVNCFFSFT